MRVFLNTSHVSFVLFFDGLKNHSSCRFVARFIVKMVAGRGSGLPRQSARWLAGFLFLSSSLLIFFILVRVIRIPLRRLSIKYPATDANDERGALFFERLFAMFFMSAWVC